MTQTERVIRHLRDHGSITSMEAVRDYGIMRLASRISDLRKSGMPIRVEMVGGKTGTGRASAMHAIIWRKRSVCDHG